ncbi:MAG: glycosyltransferase 87 family protein, partial [Candidatus Dormibacteraceae bacterium]
NYPNAPFRCPGIEPTLTKDNGTGIPLCTEINRPQVHTIYPALAEMYFLLIEVISPPGGNYLPLQIAGLILSTGVTALLLWGLWWHQLNPRWAALWAWCPLVASEAVNNAHVDILGAFLALGAVLLIAGKRYFLGGLGIGAAAAAKLIPFVLLPALIRRRPLRVISGAIGAFATLYLPYVWASGTDIIGYLPGYLKEEGYRGGDPGSRFALVRMVVPNDWAVVAGAVVLAITALIVLWRVNPDRPWATVATMVGMALLVTTPSYPWYSLLLIPFVAMAGRWEWLLVAAAPSALYLSISAGGHGWALPLSVAKLGFGTAGIIVVVVTLLRAYLPRQSLHNKRRKS